VCLYVLEDNRCQPVEPDDLTIRRLLINAPSHPTESSEGDNSGFPTSYWVTHGYLENGHRSWLHEMVYELVMHDRNANVFVIDWGKGAEPPYTQAATNIEIVGAYVGFLMTLLEDLRGLKTSSAHFIGHSLGAHMGGVVGSWLRLRGYILGRISGMDPAQPYFELFPPDARLDANDALFVDVIHTDATPLLHGGTLTGLGTQEPSGHVDFYPNAGKDQPGCNDGVMQAIVQEKGSFLYGLRRFFGCNHIRAVEYFMESIRSNCTFMAFACESYEALERGACAVNCTEAGLGACNRMGFHAKKPQLPNGQATIGGMQQSWRTGGGEQVPVTDSVLYYSMTATRAPYCRKFFSMPTIGIFDDLPYFLQVTTTF
jgi:pancreatic triacylglycerol lipase